MKYLFYLLTVILPACLSAEHHEGTVAGLYITSNNPVNFDSIEKIVTIVEEETQKYYENVSDLPTILDKNKVTVEFIDAHLATNCTQYTKTLFVCETQVGGLNRYGNEIYVRWKDCLANTALAHELLHSIEKYYLERWEYASEHSTPHLFADYRKDPMEYRSSIEYKIKRRALCAIPECSDYADLIYCEENK